MRILFVLAAVLWSTIAGASALPDSLYKELPSRRMKDLLVPRSHHMAFVSGEDIVVVGGHTTGFVPTISAEYYHRGRWHPLQPLYAHDSGFRVRLPGGRWMVAGGFDQYLGIGQSFVAEVYDSTTRSFSPLPIMAQKRSLARGISLSDGTVLIAGNCLAPDIMEIYRPEEGPLESRPSKEQRMLPFLFRTGDNDVLLLSALGNHWEELDTVKMEFLRRDGPVSHPLLESWKPIHTCSSNWTPEGCAIDGTSYLLAVQNPAGKTAIMLVKDGELSLLPTRWDIPSGNPVNPIKWSDQLLVHRGREAALLLGRDADSGLYICRIDYHDALCGGEASLCLYHAQYPRPQFNLDGPASLLLDDGRVLIIGGRPANNYEPYTTVMAYYPFDGPFPGSRGVGAWWWLLLIVILAAGAFLWLYRRKRAGRGEVAPEPDTRLMQRLRDLMETERLYLRKNLRIDDVAALMASNQKYISTCINQNTGKSFTDFVNEYRISYAKELLVSHPELKIQDVGERSGFSSSVSFHRNFLKITGKTPAQWREERA